MTAAQQYRQAREAAGLSRERLARQLADTSASYVYLVERGLTPSAGKAEEMARAVNLDAAELWGADALNCELAELGAQIGDR